MKLKEGSRFYKLRLAIVQIRHGLFFMTLLSIVKRTGLDIFFYYWVQEGLNIEQEPTIKGDKENFETGFLTLEEIKKLGNPSFLSIENLINRFDDGLKCIGLRHNGQIAAFMCIEYKDFDFRGKRFHLGQNEVYLLNMYTYLPFRGRNLAPYLRYRSYELLREESIDNIYSITDYFNKSSQKFKEKLNAKPLSFYFSLILFKKYRRTVKIKNCS